MAILARKKGSGRRMLADINVVPYVDVMLVLVVILMVAAPFVNPSIVNLPSVAKAGQQKGELPVRIIVRSDGRVSLIDATKREQAVAPGELVNAVRQSQGGNPQTPVVIEGDRQARYEVVLKVMGELQKAGIERVGLLVEVNQR